MKPVIYIDQTPEAPLKPQNKLISETKDMKDIKDYLHFYLPAGIGVYVFPDESITNGFLDRYKQLYPSGEYAPVLTSKNYNHFLKSGYKPVLRPLSDMTEEEAREVVLLRSPIGSVKDSDSIVIVESMADGKRIKWHFAGVPNIPRFVNTDELNPRQFILLLSKGFDLFNLITEGLAIDKTKLNSQTNEK